MSKLTTNRLNSTWTPLNNEEANYKIFNERRTLINKWFEKWNDSQRVNMLEDLIGRCNVRQLELANGVIARRKPVMHSDFTRSFPRVLSLYIFSFLDPQSLCRCAQVSWHWKAVVELDQLWMPKCLKLGWMLTFSPSVHETGMWKRLYIENMVALRNSLRPMLKGPKQVNHSAGDGRGVPMSARPGSSRPVSGRRPPWKGTDPTPQDTWRHNYLDNDDEIEKVNKLRKKAVYGAEAETIHRRARNKVNSGRTSARSSSLTRSKSGLLTSTGPVYERPSWATTTMSEPSANMHRGPGLHLDSVRGPTVSKTIVI